MVMDLYLLYILGIFSNSMHIPAVRYRK